jgi:hypothetical protein
VQEFHIKVADKVFVIIELEFFIRGEFADGGCFHAFAAADFQQPVEIMRRHGQDHALLRLGDPDLGVGQAGVFQRHPIEINLCPGAFAHFADS